MDRQAINRISYLHLFKYFLKGSEKIKTGNW